MASSTPKYAYTSLDPSAQQIRLITLHPNASLAAPVDLTLSIVSLLENPKYEAISYVWGDPTITSPISVDGVSVEVTTNLETALRYIRLESEARIIWADAICINQTDNWEKNVQVSMMGNIYRSCSKCLAWTGEDLDGDGKATFALIEEVVDSRNFPFDECEGKSEHANSRLRSLDKIMQRPYWSRIWVIQETVLPLQVEYWCGRSTTTRQDWIAISRLMNVGRYAWLGKLCEVCKRGLSAFGAQTAGFSDSLSASKASHTPGRLSFDSWQVLFWVRKLSHRDPLDKVYAVRALMPPRFQSAIPVDYEHTTLNTLAGQVLWADVLDGQSLRALGIIDRVDSEGAFYCPSWWPDPAWNLDVAEMYNSALLIVGENTHFQASGSSRIVLDRGLVEEGTLGVSSLLVDSVDAARWFGSISSATIMTSVKQTIDLFVPKMEEDHSWKSPQDPKGNSSWRERLDSIRYAGGGTARDAWWRTLISDHVLHEYVTWNRAKKSEENTFWEICEKLSTLSIIEVRASLGPDESAQRSVFSGFFFTFYNRSFFTTREGYMGTGPKATRSGDEVHIVAGSSWPLLLRKISEATPTTPATYRCMGKCYLHGIMDGEAAENLDERGTKIHLV